LEKRRIEEQKRLEAEAEARLKRRLPKKPLVQPLARKWDEQVNGAIQTNDQGKVVTTSIGGTELIPKDFWTLLGQRSWLNDEIINSYIEWVVDAANKLAPPNPPVGKEKLIPKYIAHNSFFYENITKKGPTSTDRLMKRKGAPGKSLLQVDTVIVPICRSSHWTVGVVRPVVKTIEYFDSFGGRSRLGREFTQHMRAWLQHQLGDGYVAGEWKEPDTGCASQTNGWDCGVFVCTNAFCVAFGLETSCYLERDMEMQRRRIAAVLINRGFHGDFSWSNGGL
jgi:Ulp1 family protease